MKIKLMNKINTVMDTWDRLMDDVKEGMGKEGLDERR